MASKAADDLIVDKARLNEMAKLYLGGADPRTPLAAPIYADLRGLALLFIQVGAAETLLDDALRLAGAAGAANVFLAAAGSSPGQAASAPSTRTREGCSLSTRCRRDLRRSIMPALST
jgi:acetyl esterase/lipase